MLEQGSNWNSAEDGIARTLEQLDMPIAIWPGRRTQKITTAVRIGKAHRDLLQYALEERPDQSDYGGRGHGALDVAVFGSTTYRVMQLGTCRFSLFMVEMADVEDGTK